MAALLLAACGGDQAVVTTAPQAPGAITTSTTPITADTQTTTSATEATASSTTQDSGLEAAPDFSLLLGDESIFNLSAELRPVYLVFWAEW